MELAAFLERNRGVILAKWFERVVRTYPRATSEFLARKQDQFGNPVGRAIQQSLEPIYDQLLGAMDPEALLHSLDGIIRIRSVQEFTPSQAVAFAFELKAVIREVLDGQARELQRWEAWADLEDRIDRVALLSFEKYTECREKLHEARNNELKSRTSRLLRRANLNPAVSQRNMEPVDDDV
jgi:hypothetical protein